MCANWIASRRSWAAAFGGSICRTGLLAARGRSERTSLADASNDAQSLPRPRFRPRPRPRGWAGIVYPRVAAERCSAHGGDGLGPVFNDSSCVACHNQGGAGGAGPSSKNVDIITAFIVPMAHQSAGKLAAGAVQLSIWRPGAARARATGRRASSPSATCADGEGKETRQAAGKTATDKSSSRFRFGPQRRAPPFRHRSELSIVAIGRVQRTDVRLDAVYERRFSGDRRGERQRGSASGSPARRIFRNGAPSEGSAYRDSASESCACRSARADSPPVLLTPTDPPRPTRLSMRRCRRYGPSGRCRLHVASRRVGSHSGSPAVAKRRSHATIRKSLNSTTQNGNIQISHSQRNPTALFGIGLIDAIPEKAIIDLAKLEHEKYSDVAGRPSKQKDGKIGRFGWKAQKPSLEDFALDGLRRRARLECAGPRAGGRAAEAQLQSARPGYEQGRMRCAGELSAKSARSESNASRRRLKKPRSSARVISCLPRSAVPRATSKKSPRPMAFTAICCCTTWVRNWATRATTECSLPTLRKKSKTIRLQAVANFANPFRPQRHR